MIQLPMGVHCLLVDISRWMDLEALQRTMVCVNTDEPHLWTEVGSSTCAREAYPTRYLWLDRNSVAFSHRRYAFTNFENDTCSFVAKDAITLNFQASNRTPLPKMYIGSDIVLAATS